MRMVQGHGINDMPRGWIKENEWNKKVYQKWNSMLQRCYSDKVHKTHSSYIGCTVCERWLLFSNFVSDFKLIKGYDEEKFLNGKLELDKDIKFNGKNKEYSLENCMLVSRIENNKQSKSTRNYNGENNPRYGKCKFIQQLDKQGNLIKIWKGFETIEKETGYNYGNISSCCVWYELGEDSEEWFKKRKSRPYKTVGGYIWKYYKEDE